MDFEVALEQELKTIAALGNRVYPLMSPEAVKKNGVPYLIYGSSEGVRDKSLDGYLDSKEVRGELNVITARYKDLKTITKQAITLLIGMEQRAIGADGPYIAELKYQDPVEMYEQQADLYRCVIEFTVYFEEG